MWVKLTSKAGIEWCLVTYDYVGCVSTGIWKRGQLGTELLDHVMDETFSIYWHGHDTPVIDLHGNEITPHEIASM